MERMKSSLAISLLAFLIAFAFMASEVIVFPQSKTADAQGRKKRSEKKKPAEKKKAGQPDKGDELDSFLQSSDAQAAFDLERLKVEEDFPMESAVGQKIDEAISKLLRILDKYQEPQTLRRLAEFYWKKAHQLNLDLMRAHQSKMEQWFENGQEGEPPQEPNTEIWFKYNRKAVEICEIILEHYPEFSGTDEVYFFMGYNLNEIGKDADAVKYYKKLVSEFPQSQFVPDTWMAIGDYYFKHNNVYDAQPAYEEVLKYDNSKVWGYAKYKIGWCHFNLGKYRDAIDTFKEVVEWSDQQAQKGRSQITLKEEALKDLVMAFAEEGDVDEAERYFLRVGGKKYFRMMLVKLASIYTNQGKLDESIKVHRRLIKEYPLHKDNATFQDLIVDAYSSKNDKENETKEILNLVYYAKPPEESAWVKANMKDNAERVEEAWGVAERRLIKTVVEYHKEARKINDEKTWEKAQTIYELYLKYFQKSKNIYKVSWNYAELLFTRKKYQMAGKWYTKVAEMDKKGEHFEDASYNAILSYEKLVHKEIESWIKDTKTRSKRKEKNYKIAVSQEQKEKEQAQREKYQPREFSENTQGFVKACNIYIDNIPKSKFKVDIIYKVAIIHYAHNHFDDAVSRFELIIEDYPRHRLAVYSANLILDSLNIKQRWRKLHATVKSYLKNPRLAPRRGRARFREDLRNLYEKSAFKKVEMTEEEKRWEAAAEEYLDFAKEFKKSNVRDRALYNASVHYVKAGDLEKSIEVQNKFLKEHKKSPLAEDVLFKLGKNYEALAYYAKAADTYEKYEDKYPKGKEYKNALYNASVFHENLGNTAKAVELRKKYIKKTKKEQEKDMLRFGIGFVWLDAGKDEKAMDAFLDYLKKREKDITWPKYETNRETKQKRLLERGKIKGDPNRIITARTQIVRLLEKKNWITKAEKHKEIILKLGDCDSEIGLKQPSRDIIAEINFEKLEPRYAEYKELKLNISGIAGARNPRNKKARERWQEQMAEKLKRKGEMIEELQNAYTRIVELKSPSWSVAALFRIGGLYKEFSLSMFNATMPPWLTMDQEVIYYDKLRQRAEPVEHKALLGYEKCLMTAYKLGVYNEWVLKARKELQGYAPEVYTPANAITFEPGFKSDGALLAQFEKPEVPEYIPPRPQTPTTPGMEGEGGAPMPGGEAPRQYDEEGGGNQEPAPSDAPDEAASGSGAM